MKLRVTHLQKLLEHCQPHAETANSGRKYLSSPL